MKTRLLMIIASAIFSSYIFFSLYSFDENRAAEIPKLQCGEKYIQVSDTCQLNPELIEPNTVVIYDMHQKQGSRLSISPHDLIMNLTNGNTVTFVNDGSNTVNIFDRGSGNWEFEDVKPRSERTLMINNTGFYEILVQDKRHGDSGRIMVLSDETNSLLVGIKAKMAQGIIGASRDMAEYKYVSGYIVSVGSGGTNPGITVGILESELEKHDDAESYYHDLITNMIPFDVPITIEFTGPIVLTTG